MELKVTCDECGATALCPHDGTYPQDWAMKGGSDFCPDCARRLAIEWPDG